MTALHFEIDVSAPGRRKLQVTLEFDREIFGTDATGQLFLPSWTPGSYLIREYARHLGRVEAAASGAPLPCTKVSKNRFRIEFGTVTGRVRVSYSVYAHELTVRTADVTAAHAYWNNACVLLWPVDQRDLDCRLQVTMPDDWRAISGLPGGGSARGSATWTATDLDHAIDGPCLLGQFEQLNFSALGVPHAVVLDGLDGIAPPKTLIADLTAIIEAAAAVFGGTLPYSEYTFMCLFADEGYGGLEHRNSTTLLMRRTALTKKESYREFLALCAHELFHVWNVKRMRPVDYWQYDYENETYSTMLWLAEGWTAYYDDLLCLRAGLFTAEQYLKIAAKNIRQVITGPGRHSLSLAESSFDAWIRLYRPDENTRNSSQNYYVNGAVAAMCLDLSVRRDSGGSKCLDDIIRELYVTTYEQGRGYTPEDVFAVIERIGGAETAALMRTMTHDVLDPPLAEVFKSCGLHCRIEAADQPQLGVTFSNGTTKLASVADNSAAAAGELHPGDEILGLNGLRATAGSWNELFRGTAAIGEPLEILIARRGVIMTLEVLPAAGIATVRLEVDDAADADCVALRTGWLRASPSSGK